jgi:hypothetical protein
LRHPCERLFRKNELVGMMAQDLGVVGCFKAVIQLHQNIGQRRCGLIGEFRKFNVEDGGGWTLVTALGEDQLSLCHEFPLGH